MGKLDLILPLIRRMKMSKFAPLIKYLEENCSKSTVVTFVDLEQILGFNLPKSAFKNPIGGEIVDVFRIDHGYMRVGK